MLDKKRESIEGEGGAGAGGGRKERAFLIIATDTKRVPAFIQAI